MTFADLTPKITQLGVTLLERITAFNPEILDEKSVSIRTKALEEDFKFLHTTHDPPI